MKKLMYRFFILCAVAAMCPACENWLDVTAPSEIREEKQFSTAAGFDQALIGCYIAMSNDALYGKSLTWHLPELLARQYQIFTGGALADQQLQAYNYNASLSRPVIENIWLSGYNVIANANNALDFVDRKGQDILHPVEYKLIKGELLAVRAYMHFDLLRVFGYGDWEKRPEMREKYTLPYLTTIGKSITPQSKGKDYIRAILNDLEEALTLLADADPVMKRHDSAFYEEINPDGFFDNRTKRLNYYAVKALMARVYLWEGSSQSKTLARNIALETIAGLRQNNLVDWMNQTNIGLNHALTGEAVFMLNVRDLSVSSLNYLKLGLTDSEKTHYIYLTDSQANDLYETATIGYADWRYTGLTYPGSSGYRVPLKMYQDANTSSLYKNLVPLLRLPELYYIAAEIDATGPSADLGKAKALLEEVRAARGIIAPLTAATADEVKNEIAREYRKEFLSEGLMFFYYKRTGTAMIPQYTGEMGDKQYVLPFPDIETANGRIQ